MVSDMLLMDRQINYIKWCLRHDVEPEDVAPDDWSDVLDYRVAFGVQS